MVECQAMSMRWQRLLIILLLVFVPALGSRPAQAHTQVDLEPRLVLRLDAAVSDQQAQNLLSQAGLTLIQRLTQINSWVVSVPAPLQAQRLADLQQDPRVVWAQVDGWVHASEVTPNDPYYLPQQQNLRLIGLPVAWFSARGDLRPIAIIDTGIDLDHPDLEAKLWLNADEIPGNSLDDDNNGYVDDSQGWNFVAGNNLPQDDNSHGSHVAGTAAAQTNNAVGLAGVAWQTPVMALKALNNVGDGQSSHVAGAILYAVDNGARVINLSLGSVEEQPVIHDAVVYALAQDCLVVAAAGNTVSAVEYPAAQPGVLAVSATDNSDLPASFTNRGPQVDVSAPGVNIFSANNRGGYYFSNGTSMSTPHVSGLAALLWGLRPDWAETQISQIITTTVVDVWSPGKDNLTGWGRINAEAAVWRTLYHVYTPWWVAQTAP